MRVGALWIQERVEDGDLEAKKVQGEFSPADALTKGIGADKLQRFMGMRSQVERGRRAEQGLKLKIKDGK